MQRLSFGTWVAFALYGVCVAACAFKRGILDFHHPQIPAMALAAPALAVLVFAILAAVYPELTMPHRLVFPLNLSLPLIFSATVYAIVALITAEPGSIIMPPEPVLPAMIWLDVRFVALTCVGQMGILSLAMLVRRLAFRPGQGRQ